MHYFDVNNINKLINFELNPCNDSYFNDVYRVITKRYN